MITLNEQIQRLRDVLVTCYNAIKRKGGTIPEEGLRNMSNLPAAVLSIPQTHGVLTELEVTANGEYLPTDYNADWFSKVTARFDTSSLPKVKVTTFKVTNDCINEDGRWEGENLIDTSECTAFTAPFHSCSLLVQLDASRWNTSKVREFNSVFYGCSNLVYLDVSSWNASNVTNFNGLFFDCKKLKQLDLRNWDVSNGTQFNVSFQSCNVLSSLIGGEDNSDNNISCLNGLKANLNLSFTQLDTASLRALINGLADVTDQPAESRPTLTLGTTLRAKLTEEDITIAIAEKGWNIA